VASGSVRSQHQSSGLRAWVALAALGGLMLCAALVFSRSQPRAPISQREMAQRGIADASARGMSRVEKINVYSTTLGHLRPNVTCSWLKNLGRALRMAARMDSYNPCDAATRVWVVELWGDYPPWVMEPGLMIYTASGDYIRSDSGP
jgi:hypothetical protein